MTSQTKTKPSLIYLLIEYALKTLWGTSPGTLSPTTSQGAQEKVSRGTLHTPPSSVTPLSTRLDAKTIEQISKRLATYVTKVYEWNRKLNLTGAKTPQQFCIHHVFDCLAALAELERVGVFSSGSASVGARRAVPLQKYSLIDVGTGAGLPGLVWACVWASTHPEFNVLLVESLQKRVSFLQQMLSLLGLPCEVFPEGGQVNIFNGRFEDLQNNLAEKVGAASSSVLTSLPIIVSRGTASPEKLWHNFIERMAASPAGFRAWYIFSSEATHKEFLTLQKTSAKKFIVNSLSYPRIDLALLVQELTKEASRKGLEEEAIENLIKEAVGADLAAGRQGLSVRPGTNLLTEIVPHF